MMAIKLIGMSEDSTQGITQTDYVTVCDYILADITLKNAHRSGALANMKLNEFKAARLVDGEYVVSVTEHKTAVTYGAAKVVLSPSLQHYVAVYCEKFRSQVISADKKLPELFLSWHGLPLTRSLQSIWNKAGLGSNITFNLVRKSVVSTMHDTQPQMSASLADLMCHRQTTAQKCYRLLERE